LDGDNTYAVAVLRADGDLSSEIERIVVGDPLEQTASCSCFQLMNIKLLPNHYLLKRWTREARHGTIKDIKGRNIIENPKLDAMLRYKFLSHKFHDFASKAATDPECSMLVDNALDCIAKQVEDKMRASPSILSDSSNVQPNVQQDDGLLSSARLKKKDVQPKSSKRHRGWLEKTRKFKKKAPKKSKVCC
jgi:zinc finger SWIM domain-containing protein 3